MTRVVLDRWSPRARARSTWSRLLEHSRTRPYPPLDRAVHGQASTISRVDTRAAPGHGGEHELAVRPQRGGGVRPPIIFNPWPYHEHGSTSATMFDWVTDRALLQHAGCKVMNWISCKMNRRSNSGSGRSCSTFKNLNCGGPWPCGRGQSHTGPIIHNSTVSVGHGGCFLSRDERRYQHSVVTSKEYQYEYREPWAIERRRPRDCPQDWPPSVLRTMYRSKEDSYQLLVLQTLLCSTG